MSKNQDPSQNPWAQLAGQTIGGIFGLTLVGMWMFFVLNGGCQLIKP